MNEDNQLNSKLKCRKCGGQHLTIKCGKNTEDTNNIEKKKFQFNNKTFKLKISNLPSDIEYEEISKFVNDWGHVNKIIVKNYEDSSVVFMEFKFEDEVDYFVKALHLTPFDHYIIKVEKIS